MTVEAHFTELRFASLVFFRFFANGRDNNVGYYSLEKKIWKGHSEKNEEENEHFRENWFL